MLIWETLQVHFLNTFFNGSTSFFYVQVRQKFSIDGYKLVYFFYPNQTFKYKC